ncbi:BglG family transcription antiterminator LicT [Enterococcus sp. LJL128]
MIIQKIFNNNALVAIDKTGEEVVVMGNGIGFKRSAGEVVDKERAEKIFSLKEKEASKKFLDLMQHVPSQYISLCYDIIQYAKKELNTRLSDYIYISLTDHIYHMLKLYDEGVQISNPLLWEIKKFYPKEFAVGSKALKLIEATEHRKINEDEAGNIAFHLINAQMDNSDSKQLDMHKQMKKIKDIMGIIEYKFGMVLDDKSVYYERFVTHLRFFFERLKKNHKLNDDTDDFLFEQVKEKYPEAYECTLRIEQYLKVTLTNEEKLYLTVHVERLTKYGRD